jgi:outer membrane protein OmpA-like peptidoglycan-associated protein
VQVRFELMPGRRIQPFVVVGGGAPIALSSKRMTLNSGVIGEGYVGGGVRINTDKGFAFRADARFVIVPGENPPLLGYEAEFNIGIDFHLGEKHVAATPELPVNATPSDRDGDGIPDAKDKCPNEPETRNGYQDDDGCPDQLPVALVAAFETATAVRFEPGHARLTDAAKTSLVKAVTQLHANPTLHVFVIGHPDAKGDAAKTTPLAQKRAEAVKWYLVDQGVPADQIETATGAPAEKNRVIELQIAPPSPH